MNMLQSIRRAFSVLFVMSFVLITIFPLWITVAGSFLEPEMIQARYTKEITEENEEEVQGEGLHFVTVTLWPEEWSIMQYRNLFLGETEYLRMIGNSVILVIPILVGQLLIAPLAAYGFEHWNGYFKEGIFFVYVIVMLMPMQLLLVPHFLVADWMGIRETYWAIILPAMFHPLGVFLIRQQIKGFPQECLEAARLDGANEWIVFCKIMRPNMTGVIAAMAILLFTDNWNIVDQAVVFIREAVREPMSVHLNAIWETDPGMFFASSVVYAVPVLVVYLVGKKYLIEGISMSAVKG